ncbi:hypothetical protein [Thermopirellula anaerolimosa]
MNCLSAAGLFWMLSSVLSVALVADGTSKETVDTAVNTAGVVRELEETLRECSYLEFDASVKVYEHSVDSSERPIMRDGQYHVLRGLKNWKCLGKVFGSTVYKGKAVAETTQFEHLIKGGEWFTVLIEPSSGKVESVLLDRNVSEEDRSWALLEDDFVWVFGYHPGNWFASYLPDVLRQCELTAKPDVLDGRDTFLLEAQGRYGHYQLWLDPSEGFLPRRMVLVKRGSDLFGKEPVSASKGLHAVVITVDVRRIDRVKDIPVMAEFVIEREKSYDDRRVVDRSMCSLSNIRVLSNPAQEDGFALSTKIPNGTPVQVQDALHLDFVWEDGRVVNVVDSRLVSRLEDSRFHPGGANSRFWLVAANAGAIGLLLLVMALRRWRGHAGRH